MEIKPIHIFKLLVFFISSFILVHLFAILGVFITFAFPIWWLLFPKQTVCFACRRQRTNGTCPWCKEITKENQEYPKNLNSAISNTLVLLIFSIISFIVVWSEYQALRYFGYLPNTGNVTFSIPSQKQYMLNEIFPLKLELAGIDEPINTIQIDLAFDPARLQVYTIDIQESFASIFIQKEIDNEEGYIRVSGGLPNPGYSGEKGLFATVFFQAITPGITEVSFLPSSLVLANDGQASNILNAYSKVGYFITDQELPESLQSSIQTDIGTRVLGAQDDTDKLVFFDTTDQSHIRDPIKPSKKTSNFNLFQLLANVDHFTLQMYQRLLP